MNKLTRFTLVTTLAFGSASSFAESPENADAHSGMSGGMSGEMHEGMKGDMQKNMGDMHKNMEGMHGKTGDMKSQKHESGPMTDGVIRKVDTEARTLTIKHGPIKNLGMPPMTMVFQTDEKIVIEELETGAAIQFRAADRNGKMTVTEVQPAS